MFNQRLEMSNSIGDRLGVSFCLGHIGLVYYEQGDYARALDHYSGNWRARSS